VRTVSFVAAISLIGLVPSLAVALDAPAMTWSPASGSNYTPASRKPSMIVIHKVEGSYDGCISWFKNPAAQVSAHYVVAHSGAITQMVKDDDIAWHAGNWDYNERAIGIENEGWTNRDDVPDGHLRALARLTAWLCQKHGIPADRHHIIGHVEVPGSDHTDPGPYFAWTTFMGYVQAALGAPPQSTPPVPTGAARAVKATTDALNVRDAAWGALLGQVGAGATFVRTGNASQGFVEVFYAGRRGWLSTSYVTATSGTGAKIATPELNVRTGAGTDQKIVGQVHQGEVYADASSGTTEWRLVWFDSRREWAFRAYTNAVALSP
jgi:N-acetyl-anhydromuramyl-L-alanine amidase AmpD